VRTTLALLAALAAATVVAFTLTGGAVAKTAETAAAPFGGVGVQDTIGDHPLQTSFKLTGRVGVTVAGLPYDDTANPKGNFTVTGVPAGATIVKALLYLTDWHVNTASVTFEAASFPATAPLTTDPGGGLTLGVFRFDVTPQVTGNAVYHYKAQGITETYGSALVIVYQKSTLKKNTIWINDGAESMASTSSDTVFTGGPKRPRTGKLWIFTQADNLPSGETIAFNGTVVGGPLDGSLGHWASLLKLDAPGLAKTNHATITTGGDWFGWHLAVLEKNNQ
jgi:hypothetical protein